MSENGGKQVKGNQGKFLVKWTTNGVSTKQAYSCWPAASPSALAGYRSIELATLAGVTSGETFTAGSINGICLHPMQQVFISVRACKKEKRHAAGTFSVPMPSSNMHNLCFCRSFGQVGRNVRFCPGKAYFIAICRKSGDVRSVRTRMLLSRTRTLKLS